MTAVGWGILGCSDIVEKRGAAAIVEQPDSRLVAFQSRDGSRAAAFAARFGAPAAYDDAAQLLQDERVDVVYVATEVDRHAPLAIAAARAGKHVLVEKPMALSRAECEAMIAAAAEHGVRLAVAYYARFFPRAAAMRRLIVEGALGQIVRAEIRLPRYVPPVGPAGPRAWRVSARAGGNNLADLGSHRLDLLAYFFGRPRRVAGLVDRLSMPYAAPDTETALVQLENGAHVTVLCTANVPPDRWPEPRGASTIQIYGTAGALLTDPWSTAPLEVAGGKAVALAVSPPPSNAHSPMIDDFARAIAGHRAPRFDGVDGMWATCVIAGAAESAATGCIVDIPPAVQPSGAGRAR